MTGNRPPGSFAAILTPYDRLDVFEMFDAFGIDTQDKLDEILGRCLREGVEWDRLGIWGLDRPHGEPRVQFVVWPHLARCGCVLRVVHVGDEPQVVGASIFFTDGAWHAFRLRRILLAPLRDHALLEGEIGDMPVTLYEPLFATSRGWHGRDSLHRIYVYGVVYSLAIGVPPPIDVTLRFDPETGLPAPPRQTKLRLDEAAMMLSSDAGEGYYRILGPVVAARRFELDLFGPLWLIRVTVARLDEGDFDIALFVPDIALPDGQVPKPGDMVSAHLRLCARLAEANIEDGNT